jgi:hypothetical protein
MRHFLYLTVIFLVLVITSCENPKVKPKRDMKKTIEISRDTTMLNCDIYKGNKPKKKAVNGRIEIFERRGLYTAFQNAKTKKYYVISKSKKTLLNNLNYFARVNGGIQVLNSNNEIVYYTFDLKKIQGKPKPERLLYCGNVSAYKLIIEKNGNNYYVKKKEGFSRNFKNRKWKVIDTISSKGVEDITFLNKTKSLEYDENIRKDEIMIIKYKNYYAIRIHNKSYYFERVDIISYNPLRVKCHNHFGYFGRTKVKYTELGVYEFNLAPFVLDDGTNGYVDIYGVEYYPDHI